MEQYLDQIAKAPPKIKFGGLAGAVAVITALNFFLVITPVEERIVKQEQEQRQLDLTLAEKQEIAQNLSERQREMDVLEQKLAEALTELPERKDIEELLAQLNDIGKKAGLEITSITPGAESPGEFFARIPLQMVVSGNYHEIALFLQEVAGMRRIVNVKNINLGNPTMRNETLVLNSSFLATTFRFVDQSKKLDEPNK